jgi:hypothetical protein
MPRRAERGRTGSTGLRLPGSTQWAADQHHRHHHLARTVGQGRQGAHRRRIAATDERRHPAGSHAHHYLCIFDKGKAIGLYHTKRLASPGQRIVLYAKDRGCSFPNCDVPGYFTEVHHVTPYAKCRTTDVNDLALGCGGHHPLAEQGWTTRKNHHGVTEWIPPPHLDYGQPRVNTYHHPEKLLRDDEDDDEP